MLHGFGEFKWKEGVTYSGEVGFLKLSCDLFLDSLKKASLKGKESSDGRMALITREK